MAFGSGYLIRPPRAYRWLYSDALFRKSADQKKVYLTFDDGPHPEATPLALDVLELHGIKATFFVLGSNAIKHPELMKKLRAKGHQIGNHGMEHLNGWRTASKDYVADMNQGRDATGSRLFRPAYGKLSIPQYKEIKKTEQVVMWDVISGDFDQSIKPNVVFDNVLNNVRNGSIIVMHDSAKALKNMSNSLDLIITELKKNNYEFGLL